MPTFKAGAGSDKPINAFWEWWARRAEAVARAIGDRSVGAMVGEISQRVNSIDKGLAWELGPGRSAQHSFSLSPEGDIGLRPTTERWLRAAPAADAVWEYYAARQGDRLMVLQIGEWQLDEHYFRIGASANQSYRRLDVEVFHPGHKGLPRQARLQSTFLFLDHLLGEDDVERWIGKIDMAEEESPSAVSPDGLLAAIAGLRELPTADSFAVLRGQDDHGRPVIVTADLSLKRIDHLFHDRHGEIRLPLGPEWPPASIRLDTLNAREDDLLARLAGRATWFGRMTTPGARTLHFVAEPGSDAPQIIETWLSANPDLRGSAQWTTDTKWEFRRELGV